MYYQEYMEKKSELDILKEFELERVVSHMFNDQIQNNERKMY